MREDIIVYINIMVDRGFPAFDFELLGATGVFGRRLRHSWNSIRLRPYAIEYLKENEIDPTAFSYEEVLLLASEYVHEKVEPQFKVDGEDDWHVETCDLWEDVFVSLVEAACLELFHINQEEFIAESLSTVSPDNN